MIFWKMVRNSFRENNSRLEKLYTHYGGYLWLIDAIGNMFLERIKGVCLSYKMQYLLA